MALPKFIVQTARAVARIPVIGPTLRTLAGGKLHVRFRAQHPIDALYGVDTSGFLEQSALSADKAMASKIKPYLGTQPSVVRRAIKALPDVKEYSFFDLGCGKARVNIIASEFPFQNILGVELSARLAEVAKKNADIMNRQFPERTKIDIIEGNAVAFPFIGRKLVIFLYDPFGAELMGQLVKHVEKGLADGKIDHVFVIYHNPISSHVFDASPALKRWWACHLPCDPSEKDFGILQESVTLIWQSKKNALEDAHKNIHRQIAVTASGTNTVFKE